jgi:hypothetical protein
MRWISEHAIPPLLEGVAMSFAKRVLVTWLIASMVASPTLAAQDAMKPGESAGHGMVPKELVGAWTLVRCDNVYPDGRRVELYGPNPTGMWLIDAQGDYMMQIVRAKRMPFAANDKSKGTPEEYRAASMDSNAHYGHLSADANVMHTDIVHASFPNWDGRSSESSYTIHGDELTYRVAKPSSGAAEGAYGEVVWRRVHS